MSKQLHFISCVEDIERFRWEQLVQLFSAKKYGLSDKFRVIVFQPVYRSIHFSEKWKEIEKLFPETKFFYYNDPKGSVTDLMVNYNYHNVHRLCSLERHFKEHPELEKVTTFYLDSDVIFTQKPDIEQYIQDDVNYLSDVRTYMNEEYLSGKVAEVKEDKIEEWIEAKIVEKAAKIADLTIEDIRAKNKNTGGAQYILKNMTSKFFSECINICLGVRTLFQGVNQYFFPGEMPLDRENKGIQSYCADMWAIQWNLWRHKLPSETPKWMDFAWATDRIEKLEEVFLLHNAGIVNDEGIRITENLKSVKDEEGKSVVVEAKAFFKNNYQNKNVFEDIENIQAIVDDENSQKYCTSVYAQEIINTYNSLIKTKK